MSDEQKPLADQVALVTGAGRGIGKAIALELAQQGANVILVARSQDQLQGVADEITAAGGQAEVAPADLLKPEDVESTGKLATEKKVSILVNNAGITRDTVLLRMKDDMWDDVMDLNLKATFQLTRAVARPMLKARYGRIINITSVVGIKGNAGQANYAASKAGMIGFTQSVSRELGARNITVNAVAPGYIDTEMTEEIPEKAREALLAQIPLGRMGKPEDIARMVSFLAHPGSDYITGQVFKVDGGML